MDDKRELETKARALISSSPDEAVKQYLEVFEIYPEQFNEWDAFYTMKAIRASNVPNLIWAKELAEKFKNEIVGNLYGWIIFDSCVKGKNRIDILAKESFISSLTILSPQKNLKKDSSFPCPTTISILKLCDAHAENLFNAHKINELLSGLDYNLLSSKSKTIKTEERGDVELSSDLEKYFALKTKALLKLSKFDICKKYCNIGLDVIDIFHYNNDLWFKMRIALSEDRLGNHEASEILFRELLASRAGNDKWFLYRDIAEIYFEQGDFAKAWKYSVDGAFYGNEPHFLIGLYLLQARILFKLDRKDDGKILAELIAAIIKEQKWNDKEEYSKLIRFYKINLDSPLSVNEIIVKARFFWQNERYGNMSKIKGTIISIHNNSKIGRIKDQNGNEIDFHKKNLVKKSKSIESLKGAIVEFFLMESFEGKSIAENIVVLEVIDSKVLVGETFDGIVTNVTDFGVFIRFQNTSTGLLHKNSLPNNIKNNFKDFFLRGSKILVKVEKITEKGIQLKFMEKLS